MFFFLTTFAQHKTTVGPVFSVSVMKLDCTGTCTRRDGCSKASLCGTDQYHGFGYPGHPKVGEFRSPQMIQNMVWGSSHSSIRHQFIQRLTLFMRLIEKCSIQKFRQKFNNQSKSDSQVYSLLINILLRPRDTGNQTVAVLTLCQTK